MHEIREDMMDEEILTTYEAIALLETARRLLFRDPPATPDEKRDLANKIDAFQTKDYFFFQIGG